MKLGIVLMVSLIGFCIAEVVSVGNHIPFAFIKADHPIDMEFFGGARWFYYSYEGKPADVAGTARQELAAKGFTEDVGNRPWYRFTKGNEEVILCKPGELQEIVERGDKIPHMVHGRATKSPYDYVELRIREPGGTKLQSLAFRIKKTILLW